MTIVLNQLDTPILVDAMTWREFKAVEQLLDRPGTRLSFLRDSAAAWGAARTN